MTSIKPQVPGVGDAEIDGQHRKLAELIEVVRAHVQAADAPEVVRRAVDHIVHYAAFHFATEERLMVESGYRDTGHHMFEHRGLVEAARAMQARIEAGDTAVTGELAQFLDDWLLRHVECDRALAEHLARRAAARQVLS